MPRSAVLRVVESDGFAAERRTRTAAEIDLHLGKRLRIRRRLLWLTQSELAAAVGVGFRQIHKYESGENAISAARLWMLAEALRVPVDYFYQGLSAEPAPRSVA